MTSVPDRIAADLEKEILEQRLDSGARFALRTELIERFGVSANAMNEALRILRERGVVNVKPGVQGGVFIAQPPPQVRLGVIDLWFRGLLVAGSEDSDLVGSWMYCGDQPHDIAFVKGANGKLHHFAYEIDDWSALLRAGDVMSMDDVPIDFGPARHGITRGGTIYFFDPSGNRNEVFSGGYRTGPDFRRITWTMDQAARGINYTHREIDQAFLEVVT
ncbi:VOC family protein [Lentzea sp. BCCO 10_0856]|uniref:VOC family protein n=1 Tax=Lentzea miocenica TaxID=3095431 RepID=A0ABU4SXE2_9PSEU|nr:VOC family protein [Lentzea sp. BCCO 10_0856]MDX8030413.1 VOC family protein [Lentzea sp. BCCO 10_0856]